MPYISHFFDTKKTTHGKKQTNKAYPMQEGGGGFRLEPERDRVYPMQEEEEEEGLRLQLLLTTNE
jgi:hypothetical protein